MHTQPTSVQVWPGEVIPPNGVLVAFGYGVQISVWRGRLRVDDGIGSNRRSIMVHRATGRLRRLVVIGHTGSISLDALSWLAGVKAGFVQVDPDGRVVAANGPLATDRPALRRAQAAALGSDHGLAIARGLVRDKTYGQRDTLANLAKTLPVAPDVLAAIDAYGKAAAAAATPLELLSSEGRAAAAYWSAWSRVPVQFSRRDQPHVPSHWRTFGTRSSPLSGGPRLAVNPANALLSYLYAILETEATIACRIVGLDPGLGVFHVDQDNRESLAADLMEPIRPVIDRFLLELLRRRTFAASDFHETLSGVCRLTSATARDLWTIAPDIASRIGRIAEDVATELDARDSGTPITGRRRQEARPYGRHRVTSRHLDTPTNRRCRWCGKVVGPSRVICSDCEPAWRRDRDSKFLGSGPPRLAALRAMGQDPTKTTEALEKVRRNRIRRHHEQLEWESAHVGKDDPDRFRTEILPLIRQTPIRRIAAATGLSLRYCALIRRGERVPHPRWWEYLREAGGPRGVG